MRGGGSVTTEGQDAGGRVLKESGSGGDGQAR